MTRSCGLKIVDFPLKCSGYQREIMIRLRTRITTGNVSLKYIYSSVLVVLLLATCMIYLNGVPSFLNLETSSGQVFLIQKSGRNKGPLDIVDLEKRTDENITCVRSKRLSSVVRTTICAHNKHDAVSNSILTYGIWEEGLLTFILNYLGRYPEVSFMDLGANIGTYTMFVASFGRTVIAVECFRPNIERIRRAVQIEKVQNQVVLIGNAISAESGKYLKIESIPSNIGGQAVIINSNVSDTNNTFVVKTIRFDDILPVLNYRNIRKAIMKVDIQWSEIFLCETGTLVFQNIDIQMILMEWAVVEVYKDRMAKVLECFTEKQYIPTKDMCIVLNKTDAFRSWPGDVFWMKKGEYKFC